MRSKQFRQQRAAIVAQARAIMDQATVSAEDAARFDTMMAEADAIAENITRVERAEAIEAELSAHRDVVRQQGGGSVDEQANDAKRERRLMVAWLAHRTGTLSAEDQAVAAQRINNAASVGTNTAGGYTVAPAFVKELLVVQKAFGGMRGAARTITTETGVDLPWPTMDDTANVATIVGENTPGVAGSDLAFGPPIKMKAWMYRSGYLQLSLELLQDSAFDFDGLIRDALATRFARGQNAHFTNGNGTTQPNGITNGAVVGKTGAAGQTTSVIYDDLVDVQHSVDPAYRAGAAWMMHDSSVKVLRKLKDADGRPLIWDTSTTLAEGSLVPVLLGAPVIVNQDMPVMAASATPIAYGNFSNYLIRDVMGLTITRLSELFAANGQVGFIAFQRTDGRQVSAAQPIKFYQNSAT